MYFYYPACDDASSYILPGSTDHDSVSYSITFNGDSSSIATGTLNKGEHSSIAFLADNNGVNIIVNSDQPEFENGGLTYGALEQFDLNGVLQHSTYDKIRQGPLVSQLHDGYLWDATLSLGGNCSRSALDYAHFYPAFKDPLKPVTLNLQ